MKKTSNKKNVKRIAQAVMANKNSAEPVKKVGIPVWLEPTTYDIQDELARLDSFAYSRYR